MNSRIKIFVSNRLDIDSVQIPNDIFYPVNCGAVFGDGSSNIQGDNTGDNISNMRDKLGEFTVQYWAWKNINLDYYGLCHYRRYLSFSDHVYKHASYRQMCQEVFLEKKSISKYGLDDVDKMRKTIYQYDVIVNESVDIRHIYTPQGIKHTVYEHWKAHDGIFINKDVLPIFLETIKILFPEYYQSACDYFNGYMHRGYNCYVMRKDIFQQLCRFQFGVIFALQNNKIILDAPQRTLGYLGEMMYGIYVHHLQNNSGYRIRELPLIYFEQTELPKNKLSYYCQKMLYLCRFSSESVGLKLLPMGSYGRNLIKSIYYWMKNKCN